MALQDFFEDLIFMNKISNPDGQGGEKVSYIDGIKFKGGVSTNTSITTKIAEKDGFTSIYTITVSKDITLNFHDIIKDNKGRFFRVTSETVDKQTPDVSSLNFWQVSAERYEI